MMKSFPINSLLLLSLIVLSSCSEDSIAVIDENVLLTDEQLITLEDPNAKMVDEEVIQWVLDNHHPLRSIKSETFTDLAFLDPVLEGKRIVQLGESGHGVREFNQVKTRLIKFFHEKHDFNVIAFESGLFECYYSQNVLLNDTDDATALLRSAIFGVWSTEEVKELFEYWVETQNTDDPLILTGFDVQVSGEAASDRGIFLASLIAPIDSDYALQVKSLDEEFIRLSGLEFLGRVDELYDEYTELVTFFENNWEQLLAADGNSIQNLLVAKQIAKGTLFNIKSGMNLSSGFMSPDFITGLELRDEGMAENVKFLLRKLYPEEKIIIWADNSHIRYDNTNLKSEVVHPSKAMGELLKKEYGSGLYSIGLYMYRGQAADYVRNIYDITEASEGSLEAIFYHIRRKYSFLNLIGNEQLPSNEWIFNLTPAKSRGVTRYEMVPVDNYDGLIFIDTVTPPDFL